MGIKVNVNFKADKVYKRIQTGKATAVEILTNEVVKDSNFFIPKNNGDLERSAISSSDYKNGKAIWKTPYARRLYHNPQYNFSKEPNKHARGLWFEEAKAINIKKWNKMAQEAFRKGKNNDTD